MPLRGPSDACFTTFLMYSYLAAFSRRQVRSTTDTLGVGTQKATPVSSPFSSGMTLPTALAVPVEAGMMFWAAPQPSHHSLPKGPSTVFWVAVMAWTVVMSPSTMPKLSWMTLGRGAKQLVVQEALLTLHGVVILVMVLIHHKHLQKGQRCSPSWLLPSSEPQPSPWW